jgi:cell division septation protein DedD
LCPAKKNNKSNNDSNLPKIDSPLVKSNSNDTSTHQVLNKLDSNQLNSKDTSSSYQHEEKITSSKIDELNEKIEKKKCVIIVGSFKKSWNAKRQLLRIKKLGYSSYSEKFGEFQRTGVEFDCDHDQLNHMLEELKTKFAADSWILKY